MVTAATYLLALSPTEAKVLDAIQANKEENLFLVSLAPLNIVSPLLNPPLLSPTYAYYFIESIAVALKLSTLVQLLRKWIRGYLQVW